MSALDKYIGNQLSLGDRKRQRLQEAEREKKKALQPGWNRLDPGNYDVIDGDTVRMRDTGALVRMGGGEGRSIDTFESTRDVYEKYPERLRAHKKALSRITGRPEWMITTNQLVDRGRVQKAKLTEYLADATQNGGIEFQEQGLTADGRLLAQFRGADGNNNFFNNQSSRDENTTFDSKFNIGAKLDAVTSGQEAAQNIGSGGRSLKTTAKDQAANLVGGGLDMLNSLAHGLSIATRTNSRGVDQFFENNNNRVDRFKKAFTSVQQQRRERLDQKQSEFNNQLYNVNYNKARKAGHGETASKFLAGATEASNTIRNLIQDPGKILDKTVESLPYMFGVGIAGRVAANTVKGIIQKEVFTKAAFGGGLTGKAATATAKEITAKWAASEAGKKVISKAVTGTAMTTVGFMEGLTTGAESYDAVMGMTEQEAMNSEKYQAYRFDKGLNHEDALKLLAEETFETVTSTVIPMAMIAGKISGAAKFEGRIFTGAADTVKKTTKKQVAKAAARQAERGVVKNTAASIGKSLAPSGRAGVQETIEESIQSGGGEFLAQLGEFDATGKEVGKGVGQATAEGGIIGFASGGGISLASRTVKALGQGAVEFGKGKNKLNKKSQKVIPVTREGGKDLTPGGSTTQTVKAAQSAGKNYDAPKALANLIKRFLDVPEGQTTLEDFNTMKLAYDTAVAKGQEFIGDSKAAYDLIKANYEKTVTDSVNALANKADEDITDSDIAYINQAGSLGLVAEETRAKLPERARTALGHSDEINTIIDTAESAEDSAVADGVIKGGKAEVERVHFEKFGDTINARGHRGMRAYRREMTEAIQNNDDSGYMQLANKLKNFLGSQRSNIRDLRNVIATQTDSKKYKYVEGGSQALLDTMMTEAHQFAAFRQVMGKQYLAWRPKASAAIANTVTEDLSPDLVEAGPAARLTPEQGGTAQPATVEPDVVPESTSGQTNTTAPTEPDVVDTERDELPDDDADVPLNDIQLLERDQKRIRPQINALNKKIKDGVATPAQVAERDDLVAEHTRMSKEANALRKAQRPKKATTQKPSVEPDVVAAPAATQPAAPTKPEISHARLKRMKRAELDSIAEERGLTPKDYSNMTKLIAAIRETDAGRVSSPDADTAARDAAEATLTPDIVEQTGETAPALDTLEPDLATEGEQTSEVIDINDLTGATPAPDDNVIDIENLTEGKTLSEKKETLNEMQSNAAFLPQTNNTEEDFNDQVTLEAEIAALEANIAAEEAAESQTDAATEAINQQRSIRDRLTEAINLRKEVSGTETSDNIFGLTNTADYNFVNGIIDAGLGAEEALSSLINELRPQVDASIKLPKQKTVDPARVATAVSAATELNQENGRTESYGINPVWPDFIGNAVQTLRGYGQTTTATDERLLERIKEKFAERGIKVPSSIGEALEQRSPTTDTLFSAVPNIMEILTNRNARRELMDALNLNTAEIRALDTYVRFYDEFWKQLRTQQRQLNDGQNDKDFLHDKLEQDGLYYFMRGGVIDPNVVAAMALESMNWLSTTGGQTMFNDEDSINGILGRTSGSMVHPEEHAVLRATGTLRIHAVEDIGKSVFKHLNLSDKRNPKIDSLFKDRLINSLGLTAISTLKNLGRIELHQVSPDWFLPKAGIDVKAAVAGEIDINFIRMATINVDQKWNKVDANIALETAYREGAEMFDKLFGSNPNTRMPSFRQPQKVDTKVARSHTDISSQMRDRIDYAQRQPWKAETALTKLLDMFNPLDYLKAAHEYVDAEGMQHVHEKDKAAVQGRNDALERDLQAAFDWHNKYPRRDFYFSMKMIRSGRIYIDSNVINPQASKVHRFLFGMKDWTNNVSTDTTSENYQDFLTAVGLGLGVKVDKLTQAAANAEINALLNPKPDALGNETNPFVITMNLLRDGPADGEKFSKTEVAAMQPALSAEGTHTLAALNAWNKMRGAIGVSPFVEISLPMETDGITNGTAAGLLQTPPIDAVQLEQARTMYHAVGIFFENDQTLWNSYQDFIADGGIDNYQSVANDTSEILQDMAEGRYDSEESGTGLSEAAVAVTSTGLLPTIEELTTTDGRKWAKDPLMVAAYGASIASIIRHVIGNAEEKFRMNLAAVDFNASNAAELIAHELNKGYQIAHVANEESRRNGEAVVALPANGQFTAADVVKLSQSKRIKPPEGAEYVNDFHKLILNFEMSPAVAELFRNGIEATYGFALGAALDMKLAPMEKTRKALNNANKLMNEIFVEDYVRRIKTLEGYRSTDDKNYVLSKADRDKILQDMHNEGLIPAVPTAQSQSLPENLELTNYASVPVTNKSRGKGEAHLNAEYQMIDRAYQTAKGELGQAAPQAAITARVQSLVPNTDVGVSGVVKMIHSLDGVNNSYAWGNYPVLNVHDAQIGALHKAREISGNTNLDFVNMHANYSLAEEIHKSLARMTVMLRKNDNRLTAAAKDRIMAKFVKHLKKFKDMPDSYKDNEDVVNQKIQEVGTLARKTNAARKALFNRMRMIHQFAIPGSQKQVTDGVLSEGPTTSDDTNPLLTNPALTADDLAVMQQEEIENSRTKIRDGEIASFVANLREKKGNINGAIVEYVRRHNPSAEDLMNVMANAYSQAGHPGGKSLEMLSTILQPHLGGVRTVLGTPKKGNAAEINESRDTIIFKDFSEVKDETRMVQLVIHELIHAANAVNLEKLEDDNPVEFTRLLVRATSFAKNLMNAKTGTEVSIGRKILELQTLGDDAGSVSEYMAYAIATSARNTAYSQYFGQNKQLGPLMGDLLASLQDPNLGTNVLHSTNDRTSDELFADETAYLLEGDKMEAVIDKLVALEQTPDDPAWSATLRKLATDLIIPGIKSAEPLYQAVAVNEAGSKNIGQIEGNEIRLEAAGNKLSTNADMSLLETSLHEYVHGFSKRAVEDDHAIRTELRRLFDLAKAELSVSDFLPEGDTSQIANERAQERYDYIFNSPDIGYHEFLAIGLTNQPLALALTRIENKAAPEPIFNSGILQGLLNVFNRILQYVSRHSQQTYGGSVHSALYSLGQNIIANNQRNMQRIQQVQNNEQPLNRVDQMNRAVTQAFSDKLTDPLAKALRERRKANTPRPEGAVAWAKSITYSALRSKDKDIREGYNEVYRAMGGGKNNEFFQITGEFLPYNPDNLGTADSAGNTKSLGWIDLLRKSKVAVDMARQNMIEHTASYLNGTFDKNNYLSKAQKKAVTAIVMKTDLGVLMENDNMTVDDIQQLLNNPKLAREHIKTLRTELMTILEAQGEGRFLNVFENQMNSLANIMIHGEATVENPMTNAHGIASRFNLGRPSDRRTLENQAQITNLIDRITSLKAFDLSELGKIDLVRDIANHEMTRGPDNGFASLLGMTNDFKMLSQEHLFKENPTQMMKGYVYEILDGDVNIEYVYDTVEERARMEKEGMVEVGPIPKDDLDPNRQQRVLFKGLKGLATYNKSVVSLTDIHGRGTNLFNTLDQDSNTARRNLGRVRADSFRQAEANQFKVGYTKPGNNMVPILDEQGNIVDYRYLMSEQNKQKILKKEDPFDKVLPRMFATIPDRNNTVEVNREVADLLWKEYQGLQDSREHAFVEIGPDVFKTDPVTGQPLLNTDGTLQVNKEARDMYNLLPSDMQRALKEKFGSETFYIRDDVVNLVMGFRKVSVANTTLFGKHTPIVRQAEKIWQEVMQHIRTTIVIRTPAVVIGNVASNTAMLLSEGISPKYIRDKGAEGIAAMRAYQKDVRAADELRRKLGADEALGKAKRSDALALGRLEANLMVNPVGKLVDEGLFTSIAEDLSGSDISMSGNFISTAVDKGRSIGIPKIGITAAKELYMLPGSQSFRAALAATQYGDFVARYIKFKHDTEVGVKTNVTEATDEQKARLKNASAKLTAQLAELEQIPPNEKVPDSSGELGAVFQHEAVVRNTNLNRQRKNLKAAIEDTRYEVHLANLALERVTKSQRRLVPEIEAIHNSLAAFIYYDMPQSRGLQFLNDNGLMMFTKFFLRIQPIIAKMYTQNPVSAFGVLAFQQQLLADPLNENIIEKFGIDAMGNKLGNFGPNLDKLDLTEPSLLQWILGPFGL